jgi:hypothetical protein
MQKISLSGKSDTPPPLLHGPPGRRVLLSEPNHGSETKQPESPPPQAAPAPEQNAAKDPVKLSGQWKMGYLYGTKNFTSTVNFNQNGNSFTGNGSDDESNLAFSIAEGTISGQQIAFMKKYDDGKHLPVQYGGSFQIVNDASYQGPYLSGEYQVAAHGKPISSVWEAEIAGAQASQPPPAPEPAQASPPPAAPAESPPNHAPQLSGKWNVGFEYNFKTVHSIMYLEQDGGKLSGHGIDQNTKEKYVIAKGWYNYPRVTLVRKYLKGKGAASDREMTFKATVSWVSAEDYVGPYLNGKTQGGGAWEAQLCK